MIESQCSEPVEISSLDFFKKKKKKSLLVFIMQRSKSNIYGRILWALVVGKVPLRSLRKYIIALRVKLDHRNVRMSKRENDWSSTDHLKKFFI